MTDGDRQRLLVDTNIFVRFLTRDDESKALACKELLERAEKKDIELYTNELVIAELAWTLGSSYRRRKEEIVTALRNVMGLPGLRLSRKPILEAALELYERFNVDWSDAFNAADMRARGLDAVCSYDAHYDAIGVKRLAPGEG